MPTITCHVASKQSVCVRPCNEYAYTIIVLKQQADSNSKFDR